MNIVLRIFKLLVALIMVAVISGAAVGATFLFRWGRNLPDIRQLDQLRLEGTTKVYARDGTPMGVLAPTVNGERLDRSPVKLDEVSPMAVAAIISGEDEEFFKHYGFNPLRVGSSLYQTFVKRNQQGASTITQQLMKNVLLADIKDDRKRTAERKIKELMLSVESERYFTKAEILTTYLNIAFWGGNIRGIRSAAKTYLGKDPINLSIAEGLYLSSLIPAPNDFFSDLCRAREGMKIRLRHMIEGKWITKAEGDAAWRVKLVPRGWANVHYDPDGKLLGCSGAKTANTPKLVNRKVNIVQELRTALAPYFMYEISKILKSPKYSDKTYSGGGLRVYTTLDPKAQKAAEQAIVNARRPYGQREAEVATVGINPYTGEILAMVGGSDQSGADQYNRTASTQFKRSPGSSIKPILYTLAIEKNFEQWSSFSNAPIYISDPGNPARPGCSRNYYCPRNFDNSITEPLVPLRKSLDWSLNLPTINLSRTVGLNTFRDKLRLLGFNVPDVLPPSSAIGGIEVTPLQMATAYASLVNGGFWIEPSYIRRIEDAEGRVLYPISDDDKPKQRRVWTPQAAFVGLDMIKGVVYDPPGLSEQLAKDAKISGRSVAGKTGTTNDVKDMWFVGSTPTMTAAVWMGHDTPKNMGYRTYSGEWMPIIWKHFVEAALAGTPPGAYRQPKYISYRNSYGVNMAYAYRQEDLKPNTPVAAVPQVEADTVTHRPEVEDLPSQNETRVTVALDNCKRNVAQVPPRADEFTSTNCLVMRSVLVKDLELYDPNYQAPVIAPDGSTPNNP
jgi:penicillin-binding protein 1A